MPMVPSSFLRIYQPLGSFPEKERAKWAAYIASDPQPPDTRRFRHVSFSDYAMTGMLYPATDDEAYIRNVGSQWLVCPWRTRLRVLAGLLSYRNSVPEEAADMWVPEEEALKAASELEALRSEQPEIHSNITTAAWHVPLRWFMMFDDSERTVREVDGKISATYEVDVRTARTRVDRGLRILREAGMAESQTQPVEELASWIHEFSYDSLIELDYGGIAQLFTKEELLLDRSATEIWSCLEALALGDYEQSAILYNDLAGWWGRVKALENAN